MTTVASTAPPRKVFLIGTIGAGKTSLVRRLVHKEFKTEYLATVGFDIYQYTVPGAAMSLPHDVELLIWDSDGELDERIFDTPIAKGASAALIVGDVVRRASLQDMVRLADGCRRRLAGREYAFIINKTDLIVGQPRPELPEALANSQHKLYWTSAKSGENVAETFAAIGKVVARRGY